LQKKKGRMSRNEGGKKGNIRRKKTGRKLFGAYTGTQQSKQKVAAQISQKGKRKRRDEKI